MRKAIQALFLIILSLLNKKQMNLLKQLTASTPKWAANALIILNAAWLIAVALQGIDIVNFFPNMSDTMANNIKGIIAVLVVIGNVFFAAQTKTPTEVTEVTTQTPPSMTEQQRLSLTLTPQMEGLVVYQIDGQQIGFWQVLQLRWEYIGSRPPR